MAVVVSLSGWIVLSGYLYLNYLTHGPDLITMIMNPGSDTQALLRILVLLAPLITTVIGYALNHRIVLQNERIRIQQYYSELAAQDLKEIVDGLIVAFANALDAKSPWTKGHSERVTEYSMMLAGEVGLGEDETDTLRIAALLHDIGKLGTYDTVLDKPGPLTPEEFELVKKHPAKGVAILSPIGKLSKVLPVIGHHHERIDGRGYPDGLSGEDIPRLARLLCIADSFDAMTAERPYKKSMDMHEALGQLQMKKGTQFDPALTDAFVAALTKAGQSPHMRLLSHVREAPQALAFRAF